MGKLGLLMRLADAQPGANPSDEALAPAGLCPNIDAAFITVRNDEKTPCNNTLYFLSDISTLLSDAGATFYEKDIKGHTTDLVSIAWVVISLINGRTKGIKAAEGPQTSPGTIPFNPPNGTVIVLNGATPRADKEYDYHDWYDQEHGFVLTKVPGWQAGRRYKVEKVYGEVDGLAHFYGMNLYDEQNGLGGPEWQKSTNTDWTKRIRSQTAKQNQRRVWKLRTVQ